MPILNKEEKKKYAQLRTDSNSIILAIKEGRFDDIEEDDRLTLKREYKFLSRINEKILTELISEEVDNGQWNKVLQRLSTLERYIGKLKRSK